MILSAIAEKLKRRSKIMPARAKPIDGTLPCLGAYWWGGDPGDKRPDARFLPAQESKSHYREIRVGQRKTGRQRSK
jgi:hypothetical protein